MQTVSFVPLLLWFHLLAITIFTGPGGGRHVTRAGGLLGRPRGAWPRSGLTVICGRRGERRGFLLGGRVVGGLLLGVGGQHGVEALFHFAEAGLECGELLVCLGDVVLSRVIRLLQLSLGLVEVEDVLQLQLEVPGNR